jgi:hypothetical protein
MKQMHPDVHIIISSGESLSDFAIFKGAFGTLNKPYTVQ